MNAHAGSLEAEATFRELPHSIEAEQALLGAVLMNNEAFQSVGTLLAPEDLREPIHQRIWEVASTMIRDGRVASAITLATFLGNHDLGGITVPQYLARLSADAVGIVQAPSYARHILDLSIRRKLIAAAEEIGAQAYDPPAARPIERLIDDAMASLHTIADARESTEGRLAISDTLDELVQAARDTLGGKAAPVPSTGLPDLDRRLGGGFRPGRLIVLAGRPGAGKTVLLTALARRAARKGAGVGVFSLEIDRAEFTARLVASAVAGSSCPMDYRDILIGDLDAERIDRLAAARDWLGSLPLDVCDRGGLAMAQIEARAVQMNKRMARTGRKLEVVLIDYLQLVQVTDRYRGQLVSEYGEIALSAKTMAKRLGICVVLLSQLSRGVESRENKRPLLSDLRGSGNIEEHADAVGMLYRPSYYDKNDPKVQGGDGEAALAAEERKNLLELIWEKNRLGPTGMDKLFCDVARSQVDSWARWEGRR